MLHFASRRAASALRGSGRGDYAPYRTARACGLVFAAAKVKEIRKEAAQEAARQLAGRPPLNDLQPAKFIFA